MVKKIALTSIFLATLSLTIAMVLRAVWTWPVIILLSGILWGIMEFREKSYHPGLFLIVYIVFSALGVTIQGQPLLLILAIVLALVAWDLSLFIQRLRKVDQVIDPSKVERRHLARIFPVAGLGYILSAAAIYLRIPIGFGVIFFSAIVIFYMLERIGAYIRKKNRSGDI